MITEQVTLTTLELCKRWKISRQTLDRDIKKAGAAFPKHFKVGSQKRWKVEAIEAYENELDEIETVTLKRYVL